MRAIHAQVKEEYRWPRMYRELLVRGIQVGSLGDVSPMPFEQRWFTAQRQKAASISG